MRLYTSALGLPVEPAVQKRLKSFDKDLRLTFSEWTIDEGTSLPMEMRPDADWLPEDQAKLVNRGGSWFYRNPRVHLWIDSPDGRMRHVKSYERFGYPEIRSLEADAARWMKPSEIVRVAHERQMEMKEKAARARKEYHADKSFANRRAIGGLLDGSLKPTRDLKVTSYGGQKSRRSSAEMGQVRKTNRELGWEG